MMMGSGVGGGVRQVVVEILARGEGYLVRYPVPVPSKRLHSISHPLTGPIRESLSVILASMEHDVEAREEFQTDAPTKANVKRLRRCVESIDKISAESSLVEGHQVEMHTALCKTLDDIKPVLEKAGREADRIEELIHGGTPLWNPVTIL